MLLFPALSTKSVCVVTLLTFQLLKSWGKLTCSDLVFHLYPEEEDICKRPCKPGLCPFYQRIYKRIREIRKIVELLEIGTVLSPDRNSDVKKEGWK